MAADLKTLLPEVQAQMEELLKRCRSRGVEMRPNEALRDPLQQARYWRQSRTKQEIQSKIKDLQNSGAKFLAACLEVVGPQHGPDVTGSIPGLSWHQWGEALDCFWVVNGKAEWSVERTVDGINGYRLYADEARKMGLTAGGFWKRKDWPHVQLRSDASPRGLYTLEEIDATMRERFGHLLVKDVSKAASLVGSVAGAQ